MNTEPSEDELDLAAEEFTKTYKAFEKAAKRLMAIMEIMNRKGNQELEALSEIGMGDVHLQINKILERVEAVFSSW